MQRWLALLIVSACTVACGNGDDVPADARWPNGCPSLTQLEAQPGDPIDGDTWGTYAQGFFSDWCLRCHSTTNVGDMRNGAPDGYNWDDPASVRLHADEIRKQVGVTNFMPFNPPDPPCEERKRIVRWLDAAMPGLP